MAGIPIFWYLFSDAQEVQEQFYGSGITGRQLAEKCQRCINEMSLTVGRIEYRTVECRFPFIIHGNSRSESSVPIVGVINTTFLNPVLKVFIAYLIRRVEYFRIVVCERHLRILVRDPTS